MVQGRSRVRRVTPAGATTDATPLVAGGGRLDSGADGHRARLHCRYQAPAGRRRFRRPTCTFPVLGSSAHRQHWRHRGRAGRAESSGDLGRHCVWACRTVVAAVPIAVAAACNCWPGVIDRRDPSSSAQPPLSVPLPPRALPPSLTPPPPSLPPAGVLASLPPPPSLCSSPLRESRQLPTGPRRLPARPGCRRRQRRSWRRRHPGVSLLEGSHPPPDVSLPSGSLPPRVPVWWAVTAAAKGAVVRAPGWLRRCTEREDVVSA